jgi:cytochrome c oxidase subunit 3
MTAAPTAPEPAGLAASPRGRFADHAVIGMALFVFTEVMMFAGFISAFQIAKSAAPAGFWPPPDQPRLPLGTTAMNTVVLIASGVALFMSHRAFLARGARAALGLMGVAIALGAVFVAAQGIEWAHLLAQGMTLTSSQLGSFFYLIVGAHALHAVIALGILAAYWRALRADRLTRPTFGAILVFWTFVVVLWPVLYLQVYR